MLGNALDVLVVGAGPAGVAAGIEARRLGLDVLVVDKAGFPRDKTCGDGLTTGALRLLDALGVDVRTLPSYAPVTETVLVSPDRPRGRACPFPSTARTRASCRASSSTPRSSTTPARRASNVREHAAVTALEDDGGEYRATLADGSVVRARWLVAADGHYSPTRKLLDGAGDERTNLGPARRTSWHAFRQYFTGVDDRRLWVLFEEDFLPGYAWVFPVGDGRANVGFGVLRDRHADAPSGKALAAQWRVARRPTASAPRARARRASPRAPCGPGPSPPRTTAGGSTHGRVLFVGDAADVVDPMTGEGIAQALETGALAARAIAASPRDPAAATRRYRADVDRALGRDLRFAALLQHILRVPLGRARRDPGGVAHPVDPPQLRPLDVRGLPPGPGADARPLAPRNVHDRRGLLPTLGGWPSLTTG